MQVLVIFAVISAALYKVPSQCTPFVLLPMYNFNSQPARRLSEHHLEKEKLFAREANLAIGRTLQLNANERKVDTFLKGLKMTESQNGLLHAETFAPALHFFKAKPLIEASPVFRFIRRMPKGAVLHGHNSAMVSTEWIIKNLTYHPNMLTCLRPDGQIAFSFIPLNWHNCTGAYTRVADERARAPNVEEYDALLASQISMIVDNPDVSYPDGNTAWRRFSDIFRSLDGVINFKPFFSIVNTKLLQDLYDDYIMYAEIRTSFAGLKQEDGSYAPQRETAMMWRQVIDDFKASRPRFIGVKFIYATTRNTDQLDRIIRSYRELKYEFPELIVGFDLVSQEDMGIPLIDFLETIYMNDDIDYFFHAGETDFHGFAGDRNIYDAVLLNTTRIGHGYSLYKHPLLLERIKQRRICLEVCPISNQVLGLVRDLRNHPGTIYSAIDVPMVIASDDPAFWGASGLSYDLYYAFMAFTSVETGLAYLKQLALNSLQFSRLTETERRLANVSFNQQWMDFINLIIQIEQL